MMGVVAPDGVEVVVLPRNAQAFLGVHCAGVGAGFGTQEYVFKLHHTGVGEKQGAVTTWDERGTGHNSMPTLSKKVEERLPNLVAG